MPKSNCRLKHQKRSLRRPPGLTSGGAIDEPYLIGATKLLCPKSYAPRIVTLEHRPRRTRGRCGETAPSLEVSPTHTHAPEVTVIDPSSDSVHLKRPDNEPAALGKSNATDT
jgi:hypothetical protein